MAFQSKPQVSDQKLRGGYYTPVRLARYLASWWLESAPRRILEPSAGDGNFLVALAESLATPSSRLQVTAVEIEAGELAKARRRLEPYQDRLEINWIRDDFFLVYPELRLQGPFDLVVGNPPYIRFQHFAERSRDIAFSHLRRAGYRPTKLANAWMAFVALSIELLAEGGGLAMVLPAEFLQVKYAAELRSRLSRYFRRIVLIGFERLVFPFIQQEVILLLADGKRFEPSAAEIRTWEFRDGDDLLTAMPRLSRDVSRRPGKIASNGVKWTAFFLDDRAFHALLESREHPHISHLGDWVEVDVGVVTGRNKFFVITAEQRERLEAHPFTVPVVGRTGVLRGLRFTDEDFATYRERYPAYLLDLSRVSSVGELPEPLQDYLRAGEREGVHRGYKCRVRRRWFEVPSIFVPDGFLFRQIHRYPLLVVNEANVTSTDTIHRVRARRPGVPLSNLTACFFNSLTLAWSEVLGRSYGGGVLELEPNEAEILPLPCATDSAAPALDVHKIDTLLRAGEFTRVLDYTDKVLLQEGLGLEPATIRHLRRAWETLRNRRIRRR